jgi:hypothetical protein
MLHVYTYLSLQDMDRCIHCLDASREVLESIIDEIIISYQIRRQGTKLHYYNTLDRINIGSGTFLLVTAPLQNIIKRDVKKIFCILEDT